MNANIGMGAMQKMAGGKKMGAGLAWAAYLGAVIVAAGLDYVGMFVVHLPGYLWYVATAACFSGAGFVAGAKTSITRGAGIGAAALFGIIYGLGTALMPILLASAMAGALGGSLGGGGMIAVLIATVGIWGVNLAIGIGTGIGSFIWARNMADKAAQQPAPAGMPGQR